MMQATHFWKGDNGSLFRPLDRSRLRGIFLQSQVCPTSVVVGEVGFEYTLLNEVDDEIRHLFHVLSRAA